MSYTRHPYDVVLGKQIVRHFVIALLLCNYDAVHWKETSTLHEEESQSFESSRKAEKRDKSYLAVRMRFRSCFLVYLSDREGVECGSFGSTELLGLSRHHQSPPTLHPEPPPYVLLVELLQAFPRDLAPDAHGRPGETPYPKWW